MRRVYRTLPFFTGPSVDRLSLKVGDEWQRSIAIADRIEGEHFLIDPGVMESAANIDKIGCEIRGEDAIPLKVQLEKSVTSSVFMIEHV